MESSAGYEAMKQLHFATLSVSKHAQSVGRKAQQTKGVFFFLQPRHEKTGFVSPVTQ